MAPVGMTLFGKRVFVDGHVKMRSLGWALPRYDCVFITRKTADPEQTRTYGDGPVKMEGGVRVMQLPARAHQRSPANKQSAEEGHGVVPPRSPPKDPALWTL